ncbi:hypothetical protein SARC_15244, partial [Sphaeroforma arctica JP610]
DTSTHTRVQTHAHARAQTQLLVTFQRNTPLIGTLRQAALSGSCVERAHHPLKVLMAHSPGTHQETHEANL